MPGSWFVANSNRLAHLPPEVTNSPIDAPFHDVVSELLAASINCKDHPYGLYLVQMALTDLLLPLHEEVSRHKMAGGAPTHQPSTSLPPKLTRVSDAAKAWSRATRKVRALKDIGDGMAWRLLGCDRPRLNAFARWPSHKRVTAKSIQSEAIALKERLTEGHGPGVLCDITHFLRCSDFVVRLADGTYGLHEVKTGRGDGRAQAQKRRAEWVAEFCSTGASTFGTDHIHRRRDVPVDAEYYHAELREVLDGAEGQGIAWKYLGDHIAILAVDTTAVNSQAQVDHVVQAHRQFSQGRPDRWLLGDHGVLVFNADARFDDPKVYAPLSVFPVSVAQRAKLMTGSLRLSAFLHMEGILAAFQEDGWRVLKHARTQEDFASDAPTALLVRDSVTVGLPMMWFGLIGFEFMKPKSLVAAIASRVAMGNDGLSSEFLEFQAPARPWR